MTTNNPPILLRDAFPNWANGEGIFDAIIDTAPNIIWMYSTFYDEFCPPDLEYFGNYSGNKKCSPLVYSLLENGTLDTNARYKLATIINNKFYVVWKNRYYTFGDEAGGESRLNGDMFYHDSVSLSKSTSNSLTRDDDFSETKTLQHGKIVTSSDTSAQSTYGYNSAEGTPTDRETNSGTITNSGTDTDGTTNSRDITESNRGTETLTSTNTHDGFSGRRSYQEILKQDRELWYAEFFSSLYRDVDSILALPIYNRRHPVNPYAYPYHGYPNI